MNPERRTRVWKMLKNGVLKKEKQGHEEGEKLIQNLRWKISWREHLGDFSEGERTILKWILKEVRAYGLVSSCSG
jgi:hypothetical protein